MERRLPATRPPAVLSADELAAVVRRATELDAVAPEPLSDLDVSEARHVLQEVGVSSAAAEQALAEWRAGELGVVAPPPIAAPAHLSPMVVVERTVPLDPSVFRQTLDGMLRRQWFTGGRSFGPATAEWLPRSGLFADMRRRFDVRGTLLLHEVGRLRLDVLPGKPGTSLVRLTADLGNLRSRLVGSMVGLPAAAGATVSLIGIPTTTPELIATGLPIGLVVAGGGYLGASRALEKRKARIEENLHILLDRVAPLR
jgi:hypothetical protein